MLVSRSIKILPSTSCTLSSLVSQNFGVFTNETLKKGFDERLKEKYSLREKEQAEEASEEKGFYEQMKNAYEDAFDILKKEESILKSYKKQVSYDEGDVIQQQYNTQDAQFAVAADNHFRGISTSEYMKRSKNLVDSMRTSQAWNPTYKERISDEYLNYDKYTKNYTHSRDVIKSAEEATEEFSTGVHVLNYMRKVDNDVLERKKANYVTDVIRAKEPNPRLAQKKIEEFWKRQGRPTPDRNDRQEVTNMRINLGEPEKNVERPVFGRLSPYAKEEIFKLHNEGWSVRDLSIRFGILPERVKVVIWNKQYFYDEIMPNVPLESIYMAIEREMIYNIHFPWVDYGLDLDELAKRDQGVMFTKYRTTELDAKPTKEVIQKVEVALERQAKKKYDIVTENFIGTGGGGFYIKDWIVYKGHGSERVNKKFKMAIINQDKPQLMPDRVRGKLQKGPRLAAQGYGIK